MRYPQFFEMYRDAIKNTWTVDEIDFSDDLVDLDRKLMPAEKHLIRRLVAFFATGDSIVANNLVLNLYEHINAPEARMYLSRQLFEEALHVQFYLNLLDNYIPDHDERAEAFAAIENIPSIRAKAEFCFKWMDSVGDGPLRTAADRRRFLLNLICFAACIEGLFFFANDGEGNFTEITSFASTQSVQDSEQQGGEGVLFVDYDHDGDLDLFITGNRVAMYRNNADGVFSDVSDSDLYPIGTAQCTGGSTR